MAGKQKTWLSGRWMVALVAAGAFVGVNVLSVSQSYADQWAQSAANEGAHASARNIQGQLNSLVSELQALEASGLARGQSLATIRDQPEYSSKLDRLQNLTGTGTGFSNETSVTRRASFNNLQQLAIAEVRAGRALTGNAAVAAAVAANQSLAGASLGVEQEGSSNYTGTSIAGGAPVLAALGVLVAVAAGVAISDDKSKSS